MEGDTINVLRDSLEMLKDSLVTYQTSNEESISVLYTIWLDLKDILDVVYKAGMVIIALVNIYFAKKLRRQQIVKDEEKINSNHRVQLLKTLILDYNLDYFYKSFDNLIKVTDQLQNKNADTKGIESQIQAKFKEMNEGFVELLQGIDEELYNNVLAKSDETRDLIINNMNEYKLDVKKVYKEHVLNHILEMKKAIIKYLFEFK